VSALGDETTTTTPAAEPGPEAEPVLRSDPRWLCCRGPTYVQGAAAPIVIAAALAPAVRLRSGGLSSAQLCSARARRRAQRDARCWRWFFSSSAVGTLPLGCNGTLQRGCVSSERVCSFRCVTVLRNPSSALCRCRQWQHPLGAATLPGGIDEMSLSVLLLGPMVSLAGRDSTSLSTLRGRGQH
jgi:hypothetical protein